MLKPEDLKNLPENFMKQMQDLEDYLITEISRRIAKQGELSETAIHQIERAALNGADIKEIEKYVSKVTNAAMKDIDREIRECVDNSIDLDNAIFKRAGYDPVDLAKSASLTKIIEAGLKQTKGELLNITGSMGFEKVLGEGVEGYKEFYQHAMDFSALLVQTGSVDYITATRMVTKKMTDKGLSWVDYASGHTNRVDVAARRAIITGVNQMNSQMTNSLIEQFGAEYVETTAHMGARPDHQIWQGQVFHIGGAKDGYPDFYEATGYGTVTGLCGANCRHSYFMFFPGISERTYTDAQLKNIDPAPITYKGKQYTYYEATQKQRQMETAIRKTKREIVSADASVDKDMSLAKSIRLQTQKAEYKNFSNIANLRVKMERTQEVGYGRSIAQKSLLRTKKNIEIKPRSCIIKNIEAVNSNALHDSKNLEILNRRIASGDITLKLNGPVQKRHIQGTKETGKSYFTFNLAELQSLLNKLHGQGYIIISRSGQIKEIIECNQDIGFVVSEDGVELGSTNRITVHYSKTRTHIVPARRWNNEIK